jgi:hypothetical protein
MRTATYKSVIDGVAAYMGEGHGLAAEEETLARIKFGQFLRLAWELYWWPELMLIEQRTFRPSYDPTLAYMETDEAFYAGDGNYYQALRATQGNAPALPQGSGWAPNYSYWFPSQGSYSGPDYCAGNFVAGQVVRNPDDGFFYACHTAHTGDVTADWSNFGVLTRFVRSLEYEPEAVIEAPITRGTNLRLQDMVTGETVLLGVVDAQLVVRGNIVGKAGMNPMLVDTVSGATCALVAQDGQLVVQSGVAGVGGLSLRLVDWADGATAVVTVQDGQVVVSKAQQ